MIVEQKSHLGLKRGFSALFSAVEQMTTSWMYRFLIVSLAFFSVTPVTQPDTKKIRRRAERAYPRLLRSHHFCRDGIPGWLLQPMRSTTAMKGQGWVGLTLVSSSQLSDPRVLRLSRLNYS